MRPLAVAIESSSRVHTTTAVRIPAVPAFVAVAAIAGKRSSGCRPDRLTPRGVKVESDRPPPPTWQTDAVGGGGGGGPRPKRGRPDERAGPVLVATKLAPPRRRWPAIDRTALVDRLQSHTGPVLVVAPPGFGKSTLLGQWAEVANQRFAWLSLDENDNDPVVFARYVVAALARVEPRLADRGVPPAPGPRGVLDTVVPELVNRLEALDGGVVLVLDDAHTITDATCHAAMALLLERAPANVRLVLSSRAEPPFGLARLRAGGDLLELRAADLAFSEPEATAFLNGPLALGLSSADVATLWSRTEGWPAALYLAYLTLQDAPDGERAIAGFRGTTRYVADYLAEMILDALDAESRAFLLETSILDRLCGPLCDAATGRTASTARLVQLERANLFLIPLDDRREWYRYHHLFADLLRSELRRREPDRVVELHRGAYAWLADAGDTGEAIRHALAAGEVEAAIQLVTEHYLQTIEWGGHGTVARWLEAFPRRVVAGDARLSVVEAWAMSFLGRHDEAATALENALQAGYEGPLPDGASSVEASAALLRAGFPRGDVGGMLAAARRAFELEAERESMWRVTVHVQLGWALSLTGRCDEARPLLERGAALAPLTDQWLDAAGARCLLAGMAVDAGDVPSAERWALAAVDLVESRGLSDSPVAGFAQAVLGAVRAHQHDLDRAQRLIEAGLERLRRGAEPFVLIPVLLAAAPIRRARGQADEARRALTEARDLIGGCADPGILARRLEELGEALAARDRPAATTDELTTRERDVLELLAAGLSQREIGRELYVSYNTVHTHIRSIYRKLGASSRAAAVAVARGRGWLAAATVITWVNLVHG